jgi:hypothetical protein
VLRKYPTATGVHITKLRGERVFAFRLHAPAFSQKQLEEGILFESFDKAAERPIQAQLADLTINTDRSPMTTVHLVGVPAWWANEKVLALVRTAAPSAVQVKGRESASIMGAGTNNNEINKSSTSTTKATRAAQVVFDTAEEAGEFARLGHLLRDGVRMQIAPPRTSVRDFLSEQRPCTAWIQGLPPRFDDAKLDAFLASETRLAHYSMLRTASGATTRKALVVFHDVDVRNEMVQHGDGWTICGTTCIVTEPAAVLCYRCSHVGHIAVKCPVGTPGTEAHNLAVKMLHVPTFNIPTVGNNADGTRRVISAMAAKPAAPPSVNPWKSPSARDEEKAPVIPSRDVDGEDRDHGTSMARRTSEQSRADGPNVRLARGKSKTRKGSASGVPADDSDDHAARAHAQGTGQALRALLRLAIDAASRGARELAGEYEQSMLRILDLQEQAKTTFTRARAESQARAQERSQSAPRAKKHQGKSKPAPRTGRSAVRRAPEPDGIPSAPRTECAGRPALAAPQQAAAPRLPRDVSSTLPSLELSRATKRTRLTAEESQTPGLAATNHVVSAPPFSKMRSAAKSPLQTTLPSVSSGSETEFSGPERGTEALPGTPLTTASIFPGAPSGDFRFEMPATGTEAMEVSTEPASSSQTSPPINLTQ